MYENNELTHYGVPGMKWGKRKAKYEGVSTNGSKKRAYEDAKTKLAAARSVKKSANREYTQAFNKAYNKSLAAYSPFKKARENNEKRWNIAMNKGVASAKADRAYKSAKKTMKVAKKAAKIEAKAVKQKYRDQYMKGASKAGKIYAKLTDADKYYAEMMYDLNKGRYKEN